jgi:hypothetical protein
MPLATTYNGCLRTTLVANARPVMPAASTRSGSTWIGGLRWLSTWRTTTHRRYDLKARWGSHGRWWKSDAANEPSL